MNNRPVAGLLPLYLELYDQRLPEMRQRMAPFLDSVAGGLRNEGLEMKVAPICRTRDEVERAIAAFEREGVDAIVTLHLAYSPSLAAAEPLARSPLPVVMCDTTPDADFGPAVPFDQMLYNHGIHGVQDLASVLRRMGKPLAIAAGHMAHGPVLRRTADFVRAAYAASCLRRSKVLRIGRTFEGMGDFAVGDDVLRRAIGIAVEQVDRSALVAAAVAITDEQVCGELAQDRALYTVMADEAVHLRSARVGLATRRLLEAGAFDAFTMNFLAFDSTQEPIDTVPFLEASKAMARGIGYAGEGDALTAALVGSLARALGRTTFAEMFCPDWTGSAIFLSHMGEISPSVAADRPVICEKPFAFTGAKNPAILVCAPRPGPAVLVNLAPGPGGSFALLAAPVEVLGDSQHPSMREQVRGWIRPRGELGDFLERYSRRGGTHHCALALDLGAEAIEAMARFAGLEFAAI